MIKLGEFNKLRINRQTDNGYYLMDDEDHEVLLPNAYIRKEWNLDDIIDVFIFRDSEDRLTATTVKPKIELYAYTMLTVVDVNSMGAFLDWGLPKDLFVPFREQEKKMQVGKSYPVTLFIDFESDRLLASSKIDKFLEVEDLEGLAVNQEVNLFVYKETELGYQVVINNLHKGLVFRNEVFQPIAIGDELTGFIKNIREDNKIDVALRQSGYIQGDKDQDRIMNRLKADSGYLSLTDKSTPEEIYQTLKMSKKAYKKAIGGLYKKRAVQIKPDGVYLI